jgi:Fe2+ or Zn2+ uptake regulation protein
MICNNSSSTLTEKAISRLQGSKGRITEQRRLILEALETFSTHPTAEELHLKVQETDPHINLSTVYRTLRWLQTEGLVSGRVFSEDERQERFDANMPEEHHHFLCRSCKRILEFDEKPPLEQLILAFERNTGARVERAGLVLHGLCRECQQQNEANIEVNHAADRG